MGEQDVSGLQLDEIVLPLPPGKAVVTNYAPPPIDESVMSPRLVCLNRILRYRGDNDYISSLKLKGYRKGVKTLTEDQILKAASILGVEL